MNAIFFYFFTTYELTRAGLHWVTVFPWPVCTAEAAVLRVRHLWGRPHPGNAPRFITYWYTPSLNTPPKTPTVHCWLMSCTASSPWIIFLERIFPLFLHSPFLWFHILCQIDKVLCVQPNKETVFFIAIVRFSRCRERKWNDGGFHYLFFHNLYFCSS